MPRLLLAVLTLCSLAGCSTYLADYHYIPRPALVTIPGPAANAPAGMNVYATVIGVHRAEQDRPESIDLRVRLENGGEVASVDPHALELLSGSLLPFARPRVLPDQPLTLQPGQQATLDVVFPFPPGYSNANVDLSGLRLRVPLTVGNRRVEASASFQRLIQVYYDPYPYYGPSFFGGVYYHRHWR